MYCLLRLASSGIEKKQLSIFSLYISHSNQRTSFGPLQVEGGLLLFGERRPLALETGSKSVEVEVIAAVIERGCFTVDIAPIGTYLSFLIESRTIGAKESEVLHLSWKK